MISDLIEPATSPSEWIVCRGTMRPVSSGAVQCPLGGVAPLEGCLDCRWLEDADDDRSDPKGCRTEEMSLALLSAATARVESPASAAATPLSLVVELL